MLTVASYSIYHSPNAYLGCALAARGLAHLPVRVERRPIFVPRSRGVRMADLVGSIETADKSSYHREDCARWAARLGLDLRLLPPGELEERMRRWQRSPWEREELPARAYYAAVGSGREDELDRALFRTAWVDGLDVNEESVVRGAAEAAGLDGGELLARARGADVRERLDQALRAFDRDACPGVPTWVVAGERFWGKDRVDLLAERVAVLLQLHTAAEDQHEDAVRVREYRDADRAAVIALWREAFPDDPPRSAPEAILARKLARDRELLLVADVASAVVGAVVVGYDGHRGWIYHLAVASPRRQTGVGRALLAAAEHRLRLAGCPKVNLQIMPGNASVARFYERLGYLVEDRVSMGKVLS
jgi:2-hydroxychromene-2-carboxylate isomerase/ribosomal protein S18 acetylase RimI-like enzyme